MSVTARPRTTPVPLVPEPAPPVRQYSFTDWQVNNPTAPPPGDRLDAEYDRANTAISQTLSWVETSLNTDGSLRAGSVGQSQMVSGLFDDIAQGIIDEVQPLVDQAQGYAASAAGSSTTAQAAATAADASNTAAGGYATTATAAANTATGARDAAQTYANTAQAAADEAGNAANDTAGDVALAQDYADVTQAWAEHMPDTIPPNILAVMGVTGDHWSARWWANNAAIAAGGPFLPLAGGTMLGPLILAHDPISSNEAATKHYVDQQGGDSFLAAGGWVDFGADPLGVWNQPAAVTRNLMLGIGAGVRLDTTRLGWNTFIGYQAGNAMAGSSGTTPTTTENVMIGTLSGANQPSGDFNTYLGNVTGWGCNYDSDNCTYLGMDVFRGSPEFSKVTSATIVAGGTGGTPGPVTITGTSGVAGTNWQGTATISAGGALIGPITITVPGGYSTVPTATDPVTGGGLTGATCAVATSQGIWNGGSNNTGVGARVMRNGNYEQCCSLGAFTMQYQNGTGALVTINNCIAIGYGSMTGDPTALGTIANCTSMGWFTGANLGKGMAAGATVQGNVFVGTAAGRYVQSGNYNTLIGYNSGASSSMTATAFATCVGANIAVSLTTGNQLTAVGFNAASNLTSGNANNVFGYQTALSLTTGSFNHFFGNSTGSKAVGGNRNTLVGHLAGSTNLINGSDNIILGYGLDTIGDSSSTINIGNTFMATVATGPLSKARIDLAGQSVAFVNALITPTAQGISIDMPNQVVTVAGGIISGAAIVTGGTGYVLNDTLNDAFGGRYQATGVTAGVITALTIIKPGVSPSPPAQPPASVLTNGSKTTASNQTGSGCTVTLPWSTGGTVKAIQLNPSANDVIAGSGTTSNAATVGFLGLPGTPGVPTGAPANAALAPMLAYNKGTNTLNVYNGSGWFHVTLTAGAA